MRRLTGLMIMVVAACPAMMVVADYPADYPTEVLADGPVAYWRLNETMAGSVSETLKYDGTYEPDSVSPPASNSTWAVFQNGTLDIVPNTPSAGLADFNDDSVGARMAMWQTYANTDFNASPGGHEWEYSFKLELETKPNSATSFMGFGVRGEGNASGKAVALAFNTSGHLCFSDAGFASIKFADLGGSSTDYDDETTHTFTVRKILEAGTMNIKTYVDGSLVDARAYSSFDDDQLDMGFGIWSGTPGTEHVIVDDVQFSLSAVPPPAVDASGNAFDGSYVAGVALGVDGAGDDASNLAADFDGADDYISGTTLGNWGSQITNGVSVEFWMKSTTATDSSLFGVLDNGVSDMGLDIRAHNPSGQTQFWLRDGYFSSGHAELAGTISKNLYDGEWHHLVWVIDDCVNNSMKVYVDGAEAALSLTSTGSPDEFGNLTDVVFFGGLNNRGNSLARPFNGTLDEIAVYDYALGADDVMIHYNAMLPSLGGTFIVIK